MLKASITKNLKSEGEGSLCLKPRELLKKAFGVPFTKTEANTRYTLFDPRMLFRTKASSL